MRIYMRFPGGRRKALTLSYDDGVETDVRLIAIMKKNGLLGTFNINSGSFAPEGTVYPAGTIHRRMSESQILEAYRDSGMEVAVHAYTHPFLEQLPPALATQEIIRDREKLEAMFGGIIRGMAYPYGTFSSTVVEILRNCGIAYSRTTRSTNKFGIPAEPLTLDPTCHHNDPRLFELAEKFLASKTPYQAELFYLWGHSYEFDGRNNWDVIERFAEMVGGKDEIWYATNIDIIDYVNAYKQLRYSMDCKRVQNPTATELFAEINGKIVSIAPGATLTLE